MGHEHNHQPANFGKAFALGITLNLAFVVAEVIYGRLANSLALVADAGHNLSDVLGLGLAWGAMILAKRSPTKERTYGFRRSSILAALVNATVLLIGVGAITWESISRLRSPDVVEETTVIWVAAVGILINGGTALLFMSGRKGDLNIRGAFVHLASDAAIALGVVLAGVVILYTGWLRLDPIVSIAIAGLVTWGTWGLLRDSVNLVLDKVPEGIDIEAVQSYLASLPKCIDVHDLHIWGMSTTESALTAHLVIKSGAVEDGFLSRISDKLHHDFGIEHSTLQIESEASSSACGCIMDSE